MDFATTTPFQLARRLAAAGQGSSSVYLLISEAGGIEAVEADVTAEVEVQLGVNLRRLTASEVRLDRLEDAFRSGADWPVMLLNLNRWVPKLIRSLDRNIVLVTRAGAVLLLANPDVAQRLLEKAPNLRNRLTDVLIIKPDDAFGGGRA